MVWFPKWRRSLKRHPNHWVATPGYRSKYGPYLLNTYEWFWSDRLDGAVHVDGRLKRGGYMMTKCKQTRARFTWLWRPTALCDFGLRAAQK